MTLAPSLVPPAPVVRPSASPANAFDAAGGGPGEQIFTAVWVPVRAVGPHLPKWWEGDCLVIPMIALPITRSAVASLFGQTKILATQWVPIFTMGLRRLLPTRNIDQERDRVEVAWFEALTNAAEVVQAQPFWDRSDEGFIGDSMNLSYPVVGTSFRRCFENVDQAVSEAVFDAPVSDCAEPDTAASLRNSAPRQQALSTRTERHTRKVCASLDHFVPPTTRVGGAVVALRPMDHSVVGEACYG
jgi:hypothetical protein